MGKVIKFRKNENEITKLEDCIREISERMTLEEKLELIKEIQTGEFFIDEEEDSNLTLLKKDQ